MPYARTAVFWFVGLLILVVAGFWKTYFSVFFQGMDRAHHFHGIAMLVWVLLLINQAWLVRRRNFNLHRKTGKISYPLAPLIVLSGIIVTYFNIGRVEDPLQPFMQSIFFLGLFSSVLFGLLYGLAIYFRKDPNLHARYMITTALVFVVPGLSRIFPHYLEPLGVPLPDFYLITMVPGIIGLLLIGADWRLGRIRAPFVVFTVIWAVNLALWKLLPHVGFWADFTAWSAALAG